jgi:hypothetical protein
MPIPMPAEYYTTDLESLMSELTPKQRRKLADWVILLAHYSRELIVRAKVGATLAERLLSKSNITDEHNNIENVFSALKGTEQNLEHLTTMVNALQATVADHSFLARTLYKNGND